MDPRKKFTDRYPHRSPHQRLGNVVDLCQELKVVNQKEEYCVIFNHKNFPNKILHCVRRWIYVVQQGIPVHLFNPDPRNVVLKEVVRQGKTNDPFNTSEGIPNFFRDHGDAEDISRIQVIGLGVGGNNQATTENIPGSASTATTATTATVGQEWGRLVVDHYQALKNHKYKGKSQWNIH